MRIVYLIHSLHTAGGMEKILTSKANWLADCPGMEIHIITSHLHGRHPFFNLSPKVRLCDLDVNDRIFGRKYLCRLRRKLDEIKPDITISLCGSDAFQLIKCKNAGIKVAEYHFLHDKFFRKYPGHQLYAGWRTKSLNSVLSKFDAFVVLSRYDLEYYRKIFPGKIRVCQIYNPVETISSGPSLLSAKRFIAVGRLSSEKNFADAIRIWSIVASRHPDWRLDIFGEGAERPLLQKMIDDAGLNDLISLKGNCSSLSKEYSTSSALLMTSLYEGFGLVAIEAASFGIPIVSYGCPGGISEILKNGENAFVVPLGNVERAAECVCGLIEDGELRKRMGQNALAESVRYSPDKIMNEWMELFKKLQGENDTGIR